MKPLFSSPFHASQWCCLLLIPSLVVAPLAAQSPLTPALPAPSDTTVAGALPSALDNTDLQLRVVEGGGTESRINSTFTKGLIVSVTNASGASVADAAVALRLPDSGPSGTFADGSHAAVAYTDATGRAEFTGLHWNQTPGSVSMRVTATKGTSHAALLLNETLTADPAAPLTKHPATALQSAAPSPQPGQMANTQSVAQSGASPAPPLAPVPPARIEPTVTVTGASPNSSPHSSKTKWIILAAVIAAGAGAGIALAGKGKASTTTASALTIGTPSVSVGAPH